MKTNSKQPISQVTNMRVLTGSNKKVVMLPIEQIQIDFYVRKQSDDDRVIYFAELYESGADIPPIEVTVNNKLVDGRHRLNAQEMLDRSEVACEIVEDKDKVSLIKDAYTANACGPKPPTRSDIEHTAKILILEGTSAAKIIEFFTQSMPKSVARKYVDNARLHLKRDQLRKAKEAVVNGKTIKQAAEEFAVDIEILKTEISGNKKRKRKGSIKDVKGNLTTQFRSNSQKWSSQLTKVKDQYEDDLLDSSEVIEVIEHVEHLLKTATRSFKNAKDRILKVIGPIEK